MPKSLCISTTMLTRVVLFLGECDSLNGRSLVMTTPQPQWSDRTTLLRNDVFRHGFFFFNPIYALLQATLLCICFHLPCTTQWKALFPLNIVFAILITFSWCCSSSHKAIGLLNLYILKLNKIMPIAMILQLAISLMTYIYCYAYSS